MGNFFFNVEGKRSENCYLSKSLLCACQVGCQSCISQQRGLCIRTPDLTDKAPWLPDFLVIHFRSPLIRGSIESSPNLEGWGVNPRQQQWIPDPRSNWGSGECRHKCGNTAGAMDNQRPRELTGFRSWWNLMAWGVGVQRTTIDSKRGQHSEVTDVRR